MCVTLHFIEHEKIIKNYHTEYILYNAYTRQISYN